MLSNLEIGVHFIHTGNCRMFNKSVRVQHMQLTQAHVVINNFNVPQAIQFTSQLMFRII